MDEDDPDVVAAILDFFYTENYEVSYPAAMNEASSEAPGHKMMFHLHVYALADKLRISDLKDLAEDKFHSFAYTHWIDPSFPAAVQFVYSIAPPSDSGKDLRDIVLQICADHAEKLFEDPNETFANMMGNIAEFGKDLSKWQATQLAKGGEDLTCPGCSFKFKAKLHDDLEYLHCPSCGIHEAVKKWRYKRAPIKKNKKNNKTTKSIDL
jgi:hypothetical protein